MNVNRNGTTFESTEEKKHLKGYQARDHVFKFQAARGGAGLTQLIGSTLYPSPTYILWDILALNSWMMITILGGVVAYYPQNPVPDP